MKSNVFSFLLILMVIGLLGFGLSTHANAAGAGTTWYLDEGTGTLTISGDGEMDVGDFPAWGDHRNKVTSIVIEEGITSVSHGAFNSFTKLVSVSLPKSLKEIKDYAFQGCFNLTEISFPENLTSIGQSAFFGCSGITEFIAPPNVTTIGNSAFYMCINMEKAVFNSVITTISVDAFRACKSLEEIVIPDSVTDLGNGAFSECSKLSKVTIGNRVREVSAFRDCTSLTEIVIPDSVESVIGYAFSGCKNLTKITMGSGVSEISPDVFFDCEKLKEISISQNNPYFCVVQGVIYNKSKTKLVKFPNAFTGAHDVLPGTTEIATYAGFECAGLTSLTIPGSVKSIGSYAFSRCTGLASVAFSEGLTKISDVAFNQCSELTEISFPSTLAEIHQDVFRGCYKLRKITFTGSAPEFRDATFSGIANATIYYPGHDSSWTDKKQYYGGSLLTWVSASCGGKHNEVVDLHQDATCTEPGKTHGSHCSVCGEVLLAQKRIDPTGHKYGQWVEVEAPTTTLTGLAKRSCTVCGEEQEKLIPRLEQEQSGSQEEQKETPDVQEQGPADLPDAGDSTPESSESAEEHTAETGNNETEDTQTARDADTQNAEKNRQDDDNSSKFWLIFAITAGGVLVIGTGCVLIYRLRREKA